MSDKIVASRYRVGELVGTGGMGAVYRADDLVRGGEVALKMLRPDRGDDRMARGYLRAEGRMSGRIAHRNVVALLDAGTTESDDPYVVMELVRGRSLRALVQEQGALTVRRASAIAQQVLAGLDAIHTAGFVHGDVKADNVLVNEDDRVTLIDFGLMRSRSEHVFHDDGMTSGTPEYMAPEVIRGDAPTIESDLYAVGALLYELLTGATPFAGGSSIEVLCRHLGRGRTCKSALPGTLDPEGHRGCGAASAREAAVGALSHRARVPLYARGSDTGDRARIRQHSHREGRCHHGELEREKAASRCRDATAEVPPQSRSSLSALDLARPDHRSRTFRACSRETRHSFVK